MIMFKVEIVINSACTLVSFYLSKQYLKCTFPSQKTKIKLNANVKDRKSTFTKHFVLKMNLNISVQKHLRI